MISGALESKEGGGFKINRNDDAGHYERVTREVKTSDSQSWAVALKHEWGCTEWRKRETTCKENDTEKGREQWRSRNANRMGSS